jgi:PAS domain S-box-containing protein
MVADPVGFRLYLPSMLAPALYTLLHLRGDRLHLAAAFLILCFGVFMILMNADAHQRSLESLRTGARLRASEREERRERAHLEALIASAPLAVAVLDDDRRVRRVNRAFEVLFGYPGAETVGLRLDELIMPDAGADESRGLEERARGGEIVRAEVTRRSREGLPVEVRVSAASVRDAPGGGLLVLYEDIAGRRRAEREQLRLIQELREAFAKVRTLKGLLPICAACKKIRNDQGYWSRIEEYIQEHSEADFSHGFCPECTERLFGDLGPEPDHETEGRTASG